MTTGASPFSDVRVPIGPRQRFLDTFEREHETTMRVLRAYPEDKLDLKPHPKCNSARQVMWTVVMGQALAEKALTTGFDWSKPPSSRPGPPEGRDEIIAALDAAHRRVAELVRAMPDDKMHDTVRFFTAPKTLGDVPIDQFLWMLLHDQIHHRGQLSVYLRMSDGRLPSIYGPTADEPWT
ncbi:MAG: DinB family protein [Acidobacteria bacterium]|nr:MAG: DinB family protein [Acidobacteriota bacterium]